MYKSHTRTLWEVFYTLWEVYRTVCIALLIGLTLAGRHGGAAGDGSGNGIEDNGCMDDEMQEEGADAEGGGGGSGGGGASQIECSAFSDLGQLLLSDKVRHL